MATKIDRQPLSNPSAWIATFFGTGLLPLMPGTWCSIVVALPALLLPVEWSYYTQLGYAVLTVALLLAGLPAIDNIQDGWGHDPSIVVIDEAIGMSLILIFPHAYTHWYIWLGLLLLFRLFDVKKPWPISYMNNRSEPWSVIADDVVAAVFALVSMHLWSLALEVAGMSLLGSL